jgi:glycosyltransferase involved in cell wall biosynthesis
MAREALWLVGPVVKKYAAAGTLTTCPLASTRLRTAIAAERWRARGGGAVIADPAAEPVPSRAAVCFVPKFSSDLPLQPWLDACRAAKAGGAKLVLDVCDLPWGKPEPVPAFYDQALGTADAVVANSVAMAELLRERAPAAIVIEDAILAAPEAPAFCPEKRVELLWFGHPANLRYLGAQVPLLGQLANHRRLRLVVVTNPVPLVAALVQETRRKYAPRLEVEFEPWSLEATRAALRRCDLAFIPSDTSDTLKMGASANRLAEALNAGRFAVATPLRSYAEFSDAAWLGDDLATGIRWALANPSQVLDRIRRGQGLVAARFSAAKVGEQWDRLFDSLQYAG